MKNIQKIAKEILGFNYPKRIEVSDLQKAMETFKKYMEMIFYDHHLNGNLIYSFKITDIDFDKQEVRGHFSNRNGYENVDLKKLSSLYIDLNKCKEDAKKAWQENKKELLNNPNYKDEWKAQVAKELEIYKPTIEV
jgi:hypothetical protein